MYDTVVRIGCSPLVPLLFQAFQALNEQVRGLDRVGALSCDRHMGRLTPHLQTKPNHPDANAVEALTRRFREQSTIGSVASLQRRQSTHSGPPFFHHSLKLVP